MRQGAVDFVFTVAPNKNSLYGENMPYYDSLKVDEENNLARLVPFLEKEGVSYVDLMRPLPVRKRSSTTREIPTGTIKGRLLLRIF